MLEKYINQGLFLQNMGKCCEMKGFLSFLVLKLISKSNLSGEEISKELEERKGTKPSPGTIYPVLKSLSENGFIEEIKSSGKMKKYKITKKGQKEIEIATKKFCILFHDMEDDFHRCCK
jgi:DNA-binding PadR family transcriptional regulator